MCQHSQPRVTLDPQHLRPLTRPVDWQHVRPGRNRPIVVLWCTRTRGSRTVKWRKQTEYQPLMNANPLVVWFSGRYKYPRKSVQCHIATNGQMVNVLIKSHEKPLCPKSTFRVTYIGSVEIFLGYCIWCFLKHTWMHTIYAHAHSFPSMK